MDAKHLIRIISDENLTEIMVRGNGMYLRAFERDDESVDYTLFDADLSEIDGGVCDADSLAEVFQYIVSDCFCGQDLQIISENLIAEILEKEETENFRNRIDPNKNCKTYPVNDSGSL